MTLKRSVVARLVWAVAIALIIDAKWPLYWWHPYCNSQSDGPGYYAWGLPFPYAEPGGASSMEFGWMPHVYLLDLIVIAAVAYAVLALAFRALPRPISESRVGLVIGAIVLVLLAGVQTLMFSWDGWPVWSIANWTDSYWSYRPALIALSDGNKPCDSYMAPAMH